MNNTHLMSGPEGKCFVFPRENVSFVFPETNCFPRDKTLSVFYIATKDKKKRKRVNSDLDSFSRFFGGDSSVQNLHTKSKSVATIRVARNFSWQGVQCRSAFATKNFPHAK